MLTFYNKETGALNVLGLLHNSVAYATPKLLSFFKLTDYSYSRSVSGYLRVTVNIAMVELLVVLV